MGRGAAAVIAAFLTAAVLAGCGESRRISIPCNPQPEGALCIKVYNDHLSVKDVIGYLSASDSPLTDKTWRFVLTAGSRTYPGNARHGKPPLEVYCKDASGNTVTTGEGCNVTLAAAYASAGDFPGFNPPKSLTSASDICIAEQVQTSGSWQTMTTPARACTSVS